MREAARAAEADDFISRLPNGYASELGQRGSGLSGGQKQRLGIARALIRKPKILILDDATSAVDMGTEARIQEALRNKDWTCTTLVIAQRVSSVMDADQIIVLDDGRITGKGTHKELISNNAIYREIVQSQFGKEAISNG
jgi:ATP-binding cassette subfamily B multidrug efflux pump